MRLSRMVIGPKEEPCNALLITGTLRQQSSQRWKPIWNVNRAVYCKLLAKAYPIRSILVEYGINLMWGFFYWLSIYYVLLRGKLQIGNALLDAPKTNLLTAIFSQVSAILIDTMIRDYLSVLRIALATRNRGVSAPTYLSFGLCSWWIIVLQFAILQRFLNIWCDLR
jgi:hypothetical protein